jgi:hypothetical protein
MEKIKNAIKWIGTDGLLHIETTALLLLIFTPLIGYGWAAVVAIVAGLGREVLQFTLNKNTLQQVHHDMICNGIGFALATIVICLCWIIKL